MQIHSYTAKACVPSQAIADQVVTAIEGGVNYWCKNYDLVLPRSPEGFEKPFYSDPKFYEQDFKLTFTPHEGDPKDLTPEKLQKGLDFLAEKYPDHLADILTEQGDASTADVFLQACLFQEIIYG